MKLKIDKAKDSIIQIRVTKEERAVIKEEAMKRDLTVTNLIKNALNEYLK